MMSAELEFNHFNNEEAVIPTPEMLHQLTRVAIEYGRASDKLEAAKGQADQSIFYLKDFQVEEGAHIGRIARLSKMPLFEIEAEDENGLPIVGVGSAYSFYYSERVEYPGHGLREEWQAFGYRWNDTGSVERAARWVESHPSLDDEPRKALLSTATDVSQLIRNFRMRQQESDKAA